MTNATHPFDALMDITARPPAVFVRGEGALSVGRQRQALSRFHAGLGGQLPRPFAADHCRCAGRAGKAAADAEPGLLQRAQPRAGEGAGRAQLLRSGVLRQFRRGSQRGRDQARAQIRRAAQERRATRSSPSTAAFTAARWRPCRRRARRRLSRCSSRRCPAFRKAQLNDLDSVEGADHRQDRRRDAGADPGRSRRLARDRSIPAGVAGADQGARPAADRRRDPDRHGPHRKTVPLRARRDRARHHDARQRHRRRRAAGRAAGDRARLLLRAWRPGRHVQRQSADVRGGPCGARACRRSRIS